MIYQILRPILWILGKIFFKLRIINLKNLPAFGGIIIASNHVSHLDPPLLGTIVFKRDVFFMARASLFKSPIFGLILRMSHAFPIDTKSTGRIDGIKKAKKFLKKGRAVVMFPEGTRSVSGKLQKGKPGIGFLVLSMGVPVVPMHIDGTFKALPKGSKMIKRSNITIKAGKPLYFEEFYGLPKTKETYQKVVEKIMDAIRELSEQKK